jgi:hypothetical protein
MIIDDNFFSEKQNQHFYGILKYTEIYRSLLTESKVSSFMKALDAILNKPFAIAANAIIEYICSVFNKFS